MEIEQMTEGLLAKYGAKMDVIQERMDANTKAMQERMERQRGSLISMMDINTRAFRKGMRSIFGADRKETMPAK
jgi:hypothetical protein